MSEQSSITDKPILKNVDNLLGIENYADALSEFIITSATPLIIGFQGEWGTGKTSLMNIVKEKLEENTVATSWVNTWEYSLFKEPVEITPNVLKGLLEDLIRTCKEKNYWGNQQRIDEAWKHFTKGTKILGSFLAQASAKKITGTTIELESSKSLLSEVAELKSEVQKIINLIISDEKNPVRKVVFFVDDLDRIDPPIAVEVLEALKNIFDIDHCVFILAIDYEVVVKGLEKKFGPKNETNEREFRSFFDKIIQVPFTMPINEYQIDNLLNNKFQKLGIIQGENFKADYIDIVKLTVGFIPRSIKRYVNSFSLLKKIKQLGDSDNDDALIDFFLFALIGIQISYPKVFRLISRSPDFTSWDMQFASQIGVDEISVPDENNELTDEPWEQILWCYCQNDPFLKSRTENILKALNILKRDIGNDSSISSIMDKSMKFASMTSVDDDIEAKDQIGKYKRTIHEDINGYLQTLTARGVDSEYLNFMDFLNDDLLNLFNDKEGVGFTYPDTAGITIYANGKFRGTKFAGIGYSDSGYPHINVRLLKDPRKEYKKPQIEGLEVSNIRAYTTKNDLKKLPFIEYYQLKLKDQAQYTDEIKQLIVESFEVRDQNLKILKKGMHAVRKSIAE